MSESDEDEDFRAPRLFLAPALAAGASIDLDRQQQNYLGNVLRLGDGDTVLVFNGLDGEWRGRLRRIGRRDLALDVETMTRPQAHAPDIHYLFAPLKRARLDYMVQKAAELGVAHLVPVNTHRTVVARVNAERMRANVIEAAEQCGILHVPSIAEPQPLRRVLDAWAPARTLIFCDEGAQVSAPLAALAAVSRGPLAVLIGPEGGFDDEERAALLALPSVVRLSLGPRIMRADTAAVAALALVQAALGDWC